MRPNKVFLLLPFRLLSFAFFQGVIALVFYLLQKENPWQLSQGWWIISGLLTNIITFLILMRLFNKEGINYFDNLKPIKSTWKKDLLVTIALMVVVAPLASLPNTLLAKALFGSEEVTFNLFFRALPLWVIVAGVFWAFTQGLVELQTYFGYIMPRLEKEFKNSWLAWASASLFLALQHIAIPLIFDWRFITWRFGMFLLFAFFIGLCLKLRPRLFPYVIVIHALMDLSVVGILLTVK